MAEEEESYRGKFIGSEEALDAYWGANQLNRPAYVKTGIIKDTGILNFGSEQNPHYTFQCFTSFVMFDCQQKATGTRSFGRSLGGPIYAIISAAYEATRDLVYAANPCPLSYIDLRTMEQYYMHCCPKALEAAMLEGGYE